MKVRAMSAIARRDLLLVRQSKSVTIPLVVVPMVFVVLIPLAMTMLARFGGEAAAASADIDQLITRMPPPMLERLAPLEPMQQMVVLVLGYLFAPMLLILPLMVSSVIAADTFAGEKERKTLEALLYTPTSDRELFLAKLASAFVPAVAVAWLGLVVYCLMVDIAAYPLLGYVLLPDALWIVIGLVLAPAVALLGLAVTVIVSSRAESFQEAYQIGGVVVLPVVAMVGAQAAGLIYLSAGAALLGGVVLLGLDAGLIVLGMRAFRRDTLAAGRPRARRARGRRGPIVGTTEDGDTERPILRAPGTIGPVTIRNTDATQRDEALESLVTGLLAAFARGDGPNALHEIASDRMRSKVGGPEVFRRAFSNELYAPLARSAQVAAEPFEIVDDTARTTLRVTDEDGRSASYVLAVAVARHGERAGRWLVSGLVREGVDL